VTAVPPRSRRSLLAALRRAEEDVKVRDEFLTWLSEELSTRLSTLMLSVEALTQSEGGRDDVAMVRLIERQVRRLARLNATLISAGNRTLTEEALETRPTDLGALVRQVTDDLAPELRLSQCQLRLSLDEAVMGRWDRDRLEQAVFHLVSNACRYGRGAPIVVRLTRHRSMARLEVIDHGPGVGLADRARLFARFAPGDPAVGRPGSGLGLHTVRHIVEAHGGRVAVGGGGEGSTFVVELPCEETVGHGAA